MVLSGLSAPQVAAVLGHATQAMSTFTTLHSMMAGLVAGKGPQPADVAASVVQAVYDKSKAAAPTKNVPEVRGADAYSPSSTHVARSWGVAMHLVSIISLRVLGSVVVCRL